MGMNKPIIHSPRALKKTLQSHPHIHHFQDELCNLLKYRYEKLCQYVSHPNIIQTFCNRCIFFYKKCQDFIKNLLIWINSIQLSGYFHSLVCNFSYTSCHFCNLSNSNCAVLGPGCRISHSTILPQAICSQRHQQLLALGDSLKSGEAIVQK